MRTIEFKMERQGLVEIGQEVEITEHESDSGCCYIIERSEERRVGKECM